MTADQHRQIVARDIEDQLAFVAFVLVDGHFAHLEVLENILERSDRRIGNAIQILVGQFSGFLIKRLLINQFFSHDRLLNVSRETIAVTCASSYPSWSDGASSACGSRPPR